MEKQASDARLYHQATGHDRFRMTGRAVSIPLVPLKHLDTTPFSDLLHLSRAPDKKKATDLEALSAILAMGDGITFRRRQGGELYEFRSAASAGALYPVEIYVDALRVEGLEPGLYHDNIGDFALERLKESPRAEETPESPVWAVFYVTGVIFRCSWKYGARAYRYILNDAGHVMANLILAGRSRGFSIRLDYDFEDGPVNRFLGLDSFREVCLVRITFSLDGPVTHETELSPCLWGMSTPMPEGVYGKGSECGIPDAIIKIHQAGEISGSERRPEFPVFPREFNRSIMAWHDLPDSGEPHEAGRFGESLVLRRSRRNFQNRGFENGLFCALLDGVMKGLRLVENLSRVHGALHLGFLADSVEGLESGHYHVDSGHRRFGCVDRGHKNGAMATACLDQRWLAGAALHFVMTGCPSSVENPSAARSYRYMMMHAGFLGQIIYLSATSLGLGCCGIGAFFDREASMVLDTEDEETLLYMVAVGHVRGGGHSGSRGESP